MTFTIYFNKNRFEIVDGSGWTGITPTNLLKAIGKYVTPHAKALACHSLQDFRQVQEIAREWKNVRGIFEEEILAAGLSEEDCFYASIDRKLYINDFDMY